MNETTTHTDQHRTASRSESDELSDNNEQDGRPAATVEQNAGSNSEQNFENDANRQATEKKGDSESDRKVQHAFMFYMYASIF